MYKVYAIKVGEMDVDSYRILPWPATSGPTIQISFYMWCIKGEKKSILVDTGTGGEYAEKRKFMGADYIKAQLEKLDINVSNIDTVVVTHLHMDHFSAYELYSNAIFFIQKKEIEFLTGPAIRFRQAMELAPDMAEVVRLAYAKRIHYLDGDEEIASGIRAVLVGGHTPGSQVVAVTTKKGEVVLCSDAVDLYRNLEEGVVAPGADLLQGLLAWDKIKSLASSPELIIPSHDPLVMERFPNPVKGIAEIA